MKYMMMFWVDEAAEATPDEDAAFKKSAAAVKELVGVLGV